MSKKRPKISLSNLQRKRYEVGWSIPIFKLYYIAHQISVSKG